MDESTYKVHVQIDTSVRIPLMPLECMNCKAAIQLPTRTAAIKLYLAQQP